MNSLYVDKSEYVISYWTYKAVALHKVLPDIARHRFTGGELWGDTVHFEPRLETNRTL
jgi:hypothetical protein